MGDAARNLGRVAATLLGWFVFVAACLVWGVLTIPATLLLSGPWPGIRERFNDLTHAILRLYIRTLLFLRLRVDGEDRRLRGPRILVANHQSWLDPIVMISLQPGLSGPARRYMFRVPVVRSIIGIAGFFPSDTGEISSLDPMHHCTHTARERGGGLLFFPEGTRSRTGEIGPFHRGAFRAAVDHDLPIQPVVIDGLDRVLPPGHLIAQAPGRYPVRVRYLAPIEPPFEGGARRDVVRALADRVRSALVEELARLRAERACESDQEPE
jgi:1-acyl-sn-glycerol-3-phosphate acyltransferase